MHPLLVRPPVRRPLCARRVVDFDDVRQEYRWGWLEGAARGERDEKALDRAGRRAAWRLVKRRGPVAFTTESLDERPAAQRDPDAALDARAFLEQLEPDVATLVLRHYGYGISLRELGRWLEVPYRVLGRRIERGLRALARAR